MALSTDDLVALQQLYARYCHAVDDGDGPAFAACFTADGVLEAPPAEAVRGAEALHGFAVAVGTGIPGIRHQVGNVVLEGDNTDATGRAYLYVYVAGAGGPSVMTTGRYADTLRKVDGQWRFTERRFSADPS